MRRKMQVMIKLGLAVVMVTALTSTVWHISAERDTCSSSGCPDSQVREEHNGDNARRYVNQAGADGGAHDHEEPVKDQSTDGGGDRIMMVRGQAVRLSSPAPEQQASAKVDLPEGKGEAGDSSGKQNPIDQDQKERPAHAQDPASSDQGTSNSEITPLEPVHLSVVACGDRLEETLVMLKSALLLSDAPLHFHIFADDDLQPLFQKQLDTWPIRVKRRFEAHIHGIQYPEDQNAKEWRKLFKPCASQRLFLPDLLKDVDALLYVDTDILFMRPVEDLWAHFKRFNSTQVAALSPEHEEPNAGWYNRFARHPYVPPLGVNSGVMLMNLTRMREARWLDHIIPYYKKYHLLITWGDQCLINIYFHYFPEQLYQYPCNWNYRPDHCMYMSVCKAAEVKGASVIHGARSTFHNDKQPAFKAVYQAFKKFVFGGNVEKSLLGAMEEGLRAVQSTQCGRVPHCFTKRLRKTLALKAEAGPQS